MSITDLSAALGSQLPRVLRFAPSARQLLEADLQLLQSMPDDAAFRARWLEHLDNQVTQLVLRESAPRRDGVGVLAAAVLLWAAVLCVALAWNSPRWRWEFVVAAAVLGVGSAAAAMVSWGKAPRAACGTRLP